ncbi:MAG: hypothetical protein KAZ26_13980 [Caldilineaceae bacterium]|nr:hypothetical protein [Caldilineaceae bacterium]
MTSEIVVATGDLQRQEEKQPSQSKPIGDSIQRWEYKQIRVGDLAPYTHDVPIDAFNELGEQGWELIGVLPLKHTKKKFFAENAIENDDRGYASEIEEILFVPDYVSTVVYLWKRPKQ